MDKISEENLNQILEGSPSGNIYNNFNKNFSGSQNSVECNVFNSDKTNYPDGSYDLCKKISRNAEDLSKLRNNRRYVYYCLHFTYWIYYKIKKNLEKSSESEKLKHLIKFLDIKKSIYRDYHLYNCLPNINDNHINELNEKVEQKYLFDYFENYDYIKTFNTCNTVKFSEYEKYLNQISELYIKHKKDKECCNNSFWDDCGEYFKCKKEFDPTKFITSLKSKGNNCNILEKIQKTLSSQSDFMNSIYFIGCRDITDDRPTANRLKSGKQQCNVFPASPSSLNNPLSPFVQPPPAHATFAIVRQTGTLESTKLGLENQASSEISEQQSPSSNLRSLDKKQTKSSSKAQAVCEKPGFLRDSSGNCREPSVRETGTIRLKLNEYHPDKTKAIISFNNSSVSSSTLNNNIFRVGIAFAFIVGIISTIFIYYKFTPFGKYFHKKISRRKRIDDYYDNPYMRHFIIHAPKSVKRKVGTRGLRFSYYSS
ncbi:PIR protein [Plasmodium brasilianum]|uniref:PIR protein n=1 Tax=Plasmodium brasilianum TaxID=5824 RepID=A0ACB9YDW2_PLABR|nr:PIR protein [Plasmodium brasilianum]